MVDLEVLDLYVLKNKNLKYVQCWIPMLLMEEGVRLKYQTSRYLVIVNSLPDNRYKTKMYCALLLLGIKIIYEL